MLSLGHPYSRQSKFRRAIELYKSEDDEDEDEEQEEDMGKGSCPVCGKRFDMKVSFRHVAGAGPIEEDGWLVHKTKDERMVYYHRDDG